MATRTRIKYTSSFGEHPRGTLSQRTISMGIPGSWGAQVACVSGLPWRYGPQGEETMTDVVGSKGSDHPCTHSRVTWSCPVANPPEVLTVPPTNGIQYKFEGKRFDCAHSLYIRKAHLGNPSNLRSLAIARIPAIVDESLQGFVSLAEMHQNVEAGAAKAVFCLARVIAAVYRGKLKESKKLARDFRKEILGKGDRRAIAKSLIGANLEWKFGWKPFLADIYACTAAFQRAAKIRASLVKGTRVHGVASETVKKSWDSQDAWFDGGMNLGTLLFKGESTTVNTVRASIIRRLKTSNVGPDWQLTLPLMTEMLGLKPSLSKGWALVPYSFVVDWFIPIGDMLDSFGGLATPQSNWIESYGGLYTESRKTTLTGTVSVGSMEKSPIASGTMANSLYTRTVDPLTGTSPIYMPPLNIPNNIGKWFTGLELVLQKLL